jgi:hypothetical protein
VSQSSGERFALTARPPVRALAIASMTTLLGAVLLVLGQARGLGLVLVILGVAAAAGRGSRLREKLISARTR